MHGAEFGSAVSPIITIPYFALILEITSLKLNLLKICPITAYMAKHATMHYLCSTYILFCLAAIPFVSYILANDGCFYF